MQPSSETATSTEIQYAADDARLMTSRMKLRLDILASWYYSTYAARLVVGLSYIDGNAPGTSDSSVRSNSLHYESYSDRTCPTACMHIGMQISVQGFGLGVPDKRCTHRSRVCSSDIEVDV